MAEVAEHQAHEVKDLILKLGDPNWRLTSGALYKIITKSADDLEGEGLVVPFVPNAAQLSFIRDLHHRSLILKARQLGFTTLICILWLDTVLFSKDPIRCGIIAQDREAAESIFGKVKFAYRQLPPALQAAMPLSAENKSEMVFSHNGASIRVATSVRGGTIHRLHVSEFGKICAKFPDKAREVVTGSIPAVPKNGILIIESTAEGREGEFYEMTQRAIAKHQAGTQLTERDYRFHFFPWHSEPNYRMDPAGVVLTDKDREYFDQIESKLGTTISAEQRAWYVATRDADFSGDPEKMWQEYPSTPDEAFQKSTEGCYYVQQLAAARKDGRIRKLPTLDSVPCQTFWDIGNSDGTAIWVMQKVGPENRLIRFYESWGESYSHAAKWLMSLGLMFGAHYLPHDADHVRQGQTTNKSPRQMLEELMPGHRFEIVPRIEDVNWGIAQTRDAFPTYWIDEEHCKDGLAHIESYRKKWNDRQGCWSDVPDKAGGHSEAADALRQHGQALAGGLIYSGATTWKRKKSNWRTT